MPFEEWAARWELSEQAIAELRQIVEDPVGATSGGDEIAAQNAIRMEATRKGGRLWRNNVGALQDTRGRWVRYGLANSSKRQNENLKSADLIGCMPVRITSEMLGCVVGQFIAIEVKEPGWTYTGNGREIAQANFLTLVESLGGRGMFATGAGAL